jgi:hypothetical protein
LLTLGWLLTESYVFAFNVVQAEQEVLQLMQINSFMRFKGSPQFREFVAEIKVRPPCFCSVPCLGLRL